MKLKQHEVEEKPRLLKKHKFNGEGALSVFVWIVCLVIVFGLFDWTIQQVGIISLLEGVGIVAVVAGLCTIGGYYWPEGG